MTDILNERMAKLEGTVEQLSRVASNAASVAVEVKTELARNEELNEALRRQVERHSDKSEKRYEDLNTKIDDMFKKFNDRLGEVLSVVQTNQGRDGVLKYVIGLIVTIIIGFITKSMGLW